jgi:hypothetical protein
LRKWNLEATEYILVTCSNTWGLAALHAAILKQAGYVVEQSSTLTVRGSHKITAKVGGRMGIGLFGASGEAAGEASKESTTASTTIQLELDPGDVNDIIHALTGLPDPKWRYVVLEDFHYLPETTQREFAVALKAFHESSPLTFIVVGVWRDKNRLIQHNGDLSGRVISVDADLWSEPELREVVELGEKKLNITFDAGFKEGLLRGCYDSVAVLQESCYLACQISGVTATRDYAVFVDPDLSAPDVVRQVVENDAARYQSFLRNFSGGFMETELEMYKWLLLPVLDASREQLERGLLYRDVGATIDAFHPAGELNRGNLTQALQSTASLQVKKGITPIILDYDQTSRRLHIVDRGFLIWLDLQNRNELKRELALPC